VTGLQLTVAEQGNVIPIFYVFPRGETRVLRFCDDFVETFTRQYLAFRRNQPILVQSERKLHELISLARATGEDDLARWLESYHTATERDVVFRVRFSANLPMRMAQDHPWRFMGMLDEFQRAEVTLDDVARAAAYEVTQGDIFRQLDLRFQEMFVRRPDLDFGRRLLYRFSQDPQAEYHSEALAAELGLNHEQVVELIDVLALSDLIKVGYWDIATSSVSPMRSCASSCGCSMNGTWSKPT